MKLTLKLFAIRNLTTGQILPGLFFMNKKDAKLKREELGSTSHCVTYGPDHRMYKR